MKGARFRERLGWIVLATVAALSKLAAWVDEVVPEARDRSRHW